jgi:transposase
MEIIKMNQKELKKGEIISKVMEGTLRRKEAACMLNLSLKQIHRLCKKYRKKGLLSLVHKNRGKASNRKINSKTRKQALELIQTKYADFGPQLIKEQLEERHHLQVSREWIRQLMIKENIWKVNKRKNLPLYQRRARREREGELIQIDGSYEKWFEDRAPKCCLIKMIDDATGKIQEMRFVNHESTDDYFKVMKNYIKNHKMPLAVYSDKHMIFKSPIGNLTQFGRALKELDIELIHANTPQAKGRVERSFGTTQDRLPKMMRLEGIDSIEAGNNYIKKFFKEDYNKRFAREPKSKENAHRELPRKIKLNYILCIKEKRRISKNLTIQYKNKIYQLIPKGNKRRLIGKTILLYEIQGKVVLEHIGVRYDYTIYEEQPYAEKVMDRKKLEAFLDRKKPISIIERHRRKKFANF